ncbi:MAG: V-type ATPase 116kDa subunit family protein [Candidatus Omnitrophota bacterium]
MERVYLLLPEVKKEVLIKELEEAGLMELTEIPEEEFPVLSVPSSFSGPEEVLKEKAKKVEENLAQLNYLLEFLKPDKTETQITSPGFPLTTRGNDREGTRGNDKFAELVSSFPLPEFFTESKSLERHLTEIQNLSNRLQKAAEEITPLISLDVPLKDLKQTDHIGMLLCRVDTRQSPCHTPKNRSKSIAGRVLRRNLSTFYQELDNIEDIQTLSISNRKKSVILFLAFWKDNEKKINEILGGLKAEIIYPPDYRKTPTEAVARIQRLLEKNSQRLERLKIKKNTLRNNLPQILTLLDLYLIQKEEISAQYKMRATERVAILSGWIRSKDWQHLETRLRDSFPEIGLIHRKPKEGETVPVALENGPVGRPFEAVVDLYGRTTYQGFDPSIYLSVFFTLSFAFCFSDLGYGLVLASLSLWLMRRFKSESARKMLKVFAASGIAAAFAGIITNSWFGNFFSLFPALSHLGKLQARIALISPTDNPADTMRLFYFTLIFGYIQITTGIFLKLKESIRRFGTRGALESAPPLFFQIGIPLLAILLLLRTKSAAAANAIPVVGILLAISAILIISNSWRSYREIVLKLFWSANTIYGLIVGNLLADVLSYARIFALGLTSGLLAVTVNQLAGMARVFPIVGPLAFIIVLLVGHTFNLFISTLGSYVHTSRLQYLEFFTKFYESGGRTFNPFRKVYRYIQ